VIRDTYTVWKKEIRELISSYNSIRSFILRCGFFLAFFGVFLPLRQKELWLEGLVPGLILASVPFFVSNWFIADSIAGERERKTLETLLATRLSCGCIVIGKILAALMLSWLFTITTMVLSLVTLNFVTKSDSIFLYPAFTVICASITSLATGLFIIAIGIFISMKASSVREAQQSLGIPILVFFLLTGFVLPEIIELIPESTGLRLLNTLDRIDPMGMLVTVSILLTGLDMLMILFLVSAFNRATVIDRS